MTKDEIIQMAKDAGAIPIHKDYAQRALVGNENIERFAALVAGKERNAGQKWFDAVTAQHKADILAEREACAKVADGYIGADPIAAAIRARGNK